MFAVPVHKSKDQSRSMPYEPQVPINQLLSHSVSPHLVAKVADPIPFVIGKYEANSLPETLDFDEQWLRKAFKPKTHYSVVVAAFTKTEVCLLLLSHGESPFNTASYHTGRLRNSLLLQ